MLEVVMQLLPYSKGAKKWLVLNLITSIIGNIMILINPLLIGRLIGTLIKGSVDFNNVISKLIVIAIFYVLGSATLYLSQACSHNYATLVTKNLRTKAFNVVTHSKIKYLDGVQTGDIMNRFSQDIDLIFDSLSQFFMNIFQGGTTVILSLILMIYLNIYLTLVVLAVVPIIFIYSKLTRNKSGKRFFKLQSLTGNLTASAKEYFDEKKLIEAYSYQDKAKANFKEINDELSSVSTKAYFVASINNPTYRLFNNIAFAMLGLVSIILTKGGNIIEVSVLTSMIMYAQMFQRPFNDYSSLTANFMAGKAGMKRIFEVIDNHVEEEVTPFNIKDRASRGKVVFENVFFSYNKKVSLIENFSLTVNPGQKVAIVGPTGAGKSTMINLLMRFYDVREGSIKLDDKDIKDYNRKALRLSFGLVLQEPWLFSGSILDNLKYGKKEATDEEVIIAAKKANCHDFIMNLKDGYLTKLDENSNLSTGQKQLLTIARALVIDPPMLILDEATSSIDSLMEQDIQKTFDLVMKDRTSFIIAHRLKTIVDSDIIIVMDKGNIVEYGKHDELLNNNGLYSKLFLSQYQSEE
ncbi:ABC transporter ATP-binding protein [Haploplasma modicum]|uniref:ABC transporter ATP-binding protein n=1 Tax=Haploplasma modicum TaxID=2150 RepID=UPI00068B19F7|nr:ABC transporter ATP-binding protein [Haploplasma modicum]